MRLQDESKSDNYSEQSVEFLEQSEKMEQT